MAADPKPLQPYRKVQAKYDATLARMLEITAKSIRRRILSLGVGIGADIRKAQLQLVLREVTKAQVSMWRNGILPEITAGLDAGEKAAEDALETMMRPVYVGMPERAADVLRNAFKASARAGLASDAARRKRELSKLVYHQGALQSGKVEDIIRQGIISNLSAKELAKDVYEYVSPTTKGGASYAAMRLARTEINNAFHERQINGAQRPGVRAAKWNLSGSHVVPDLCNVYADHAAGSGEWPVDQIPDKPHPHCFCFLTYLTASPEEFQAQLAAGDFDDELDRRTKANLARLGVATHKGPSTTPAKKVAPKKVTPLRVKKTVGKDQTDWLASQMRDGYADNPFTKPKTGYGDPRDHKLAAIGIRQGFDGPVSVADIDAEVKKGGVELWRGVVSFLGTSEAKPRSAEDIVKGFQSGAYEPGTGIYGNGYYFSVAKRVGEHFAGDGGDEGKVFRAALRPDAKVITYEELKKAKTEWIKKFREKEFDAAEFFKDFQTPADKYPPSMIDIIGDPGRLAALLGYDAILVQNQQDGAPFVKGEPSGKSSSGFKFSAHDQYVVLNRTAIVMEAL